MVSKNQIKLITSLQHKKYRQEQQLFLAEGVKVIQYSEKAVAIYGNTKPIKDTLKSIGARFNPFLTIEGTKQAGWILPSAQREKLSAIQL